MNTTFYDYKSSFNNQQCHLKRQDNLVMNRDVTITCHHMSVICWIYLFINGLRGPK